MWIASIIVLAILAGLIIPYAVSIIFGVFAVFFSFIPSIILTVLCFGLCIYIIYRKGWLKTLPKTLKIIVIILFVSSSVIGARLYLIEAQQIFERAGELEKLKNYKRAVQTYQRVIYFYPLSRGEIWMGCILYRVRLAKVSELSAGDLYKKELEQYEKAIKTYKHYVHKYPSSRDVLEVYGKILECYNSLNRYDKSLYKLLKAYQKAIDKNPRGASKAQWDIASTLERLERPEEAIAAYLKYKENYPQSTFANYALSSAAEIYERKFEDYEKAIELYRLAGNLSEVGRIQAQRAKELKTVDINEVIKDYQKNLEKQKKIFKERKKYLGQEYSPSIEPALEADIAIRRILLNQGRFYHQVKNYSKALESFKGALTGYTIPPKGPETTSFYDDYCDLTALAQYWMALSYWHLGKNALALQSFLAAEMKDVGIFGEYYAGGWEYEEYEKFLKKIKPKILERDRTITDKEFKQTITKLSKEVEKIRSTWDGALTVKGVQIQYFIATLFEARGDSEQTLIEYKKILPYFPSDSSFSEKVRNKIAVFDWKVREAERLPELKPPKEEKEVDRLLVQAMRAEARDRREAKRILKIIIEKDPEGKKGYQGAISLAYIMIANWAEAEGNYQEAAEYLEKYMSIKQDEKDTLTSLSRVARIYENKLYDYPKAISAYQKIIRISPDSYKGRNAAEWLSEVQAKLKAQKELEAQIEKIK